MIARLFALTERLGRIFDRALGWHAPRYEEGLGFDGCSFTSVCRYCGKPILQDSQGNWF